MKIHRREARVKKAEFELRDAVSAVVEKHDLTEAESLRVVNTALSEWIASVAKYAIREERHGTTDKPGGLE